MDTKEQKTKKADCFYITLHLMQCFLKGHKNIQACLTENGIKPSEPIYPYLVHGYVDESSSSSKRIKHAWVEVDGQVIEYSGTNEHVYTVDAYKRTHGAEESKRFTA